MTSRISAEKRLGLAAHRLRHHSSTAMQGKYHVAGHTLCPSTPPDSTSVIGEFMSAT